MAAIKLPKTLAACADRLYELEHDLDGTRAKAKAIIAQLDAEYDQLVKHLLEKMPGQEASVVGGVRGLVERKRKNVATVKDWNAFWDKFNPKRDRDLLQRRLSNEACRLRWEDGKKIPGVESFPVDYLSIRKV